jgi:NAD(P)-dependent dehydrogenase (short-subunit alcohol dehydrogenase family)
MGLLDGKSAIVTGAAQGLGSAFASALAREGAGVTLCDLKTEIENVGAQIRSDGGDARPLIADVSQRADVERLVATAVEAFGGIDILVNNAGKWAQTLVTDPFEKAVADWDDIAGTNLKGVLLCARACVPHLIARGGGDIVNISTYYVLPAHSPGTNSPTTDVYDATKWALNGFTEAWALALAKHRIRVNAFCMGATDTPMLRGLWDGDPPADFAATWMKPDEIAGQLLDLLREGPDGRSGENIGAWAGEPIELGPPKPAHRAITG